MLLVMDAGNTRIHVGCFENEELICRFSLGVTAHRTEDEYALLLFNLLQRNGCGNSRIQGVMIASVVPSLTGTLRKAISTLTDAEILAVGPGVKTGFPIRLDNPSELGADLVANAAGTIALVGYPAIIADFGTANTVMAIDRNGAYIGGCIMAGVGMSLDALNSARLLPDISVESTISSLGKNTKDCMRAGVLQGSAMAVQGFVQLYRKLPAVGKNAALVVTGGYAEWMMPYLSSEAQYAPYLTLEGLRAIWVLNQTKN